MVATLHGATDENRGHSGCRSFASRSGPIIDLVASPTGNGFDRPVCNEPRPLQRGSEIWPQSVATCLLVVDTALQRLFEVERWTSRRSVGPD